MPFYYAQALYFFTSVESDESQTKRRVSARTYIHTRAVYDIVAKILKFEKPKTRDVNLVGTVIASQVQYVQLLLQVCLFVFCGAAAQRRPWPPHF